MKFYRKYLVIFICAILAGLSLHILLFYINLGVPISSQKHHHGWYQVKNTYVSSINQPKLIFVSGSNSLFGVDTERIESELHIPTVNYGVAASLNLYTIHQVRQYLKKGDIVILPLEYRFYELSHTAFESNYVQYILGYAPDVFHAMPLDSKINFITQLTPRELLKATYQQLYPPKAPEKDGYDSKYLNSNGDMTNNHIEEMTPADTLRNKISPTVFKSPPVTTDAQQELENFLMYCQGNGIKVYAAWPNYLWKEKEFTGKDLDGIHAIEKFYHEHDVEILGNYTDCLYDAEMFYDTEYHLNEEGKRIHTDYLIELLKEKLR